jgi:DnaJ-class molecular chaperone
MRDPYQVLGVARIATDAEIKKAYRKLAKQHHPDANQDDAKAAQRFAEITGAYDLLTDRAKRAQFDRGEIDADGKPVHRGFNPFGGAEAAGGGPFRRWSGRGERGGFHPEDVFSEIFSSFGERTARPPRRGRDLGYTLKVSFVDAARGTKTRVTLGGGKTLDVNIPAGVAGGQQIRLRGQGEAAPLGGPPGDALVTVEIEPHPLFVREGNDIRLELPITLYEAVLGAKVRVPTLDGSVEVTVPPNSSSGKVLRLKDRGIRLTGQALPGDQLISLRIVLPDQAGEDLKTFARMLQDKTPYSVRGRHFGNKP